jgi:hypothetical protein
MFLTVQSINRLIQDLITNTLELHVENIEQRCVYYEILRHINIITMEL